MRGRRWLDELTGYALAVTTVSVALVCGLYLPGLDQAESALLLAAVAVTAWYGGFWPGLLATVAATLLLDFFFLPELYRLELGLPTFIWLGAFFMVALLLNSLHTMQKKLTAATSLQNQRMNDFVSIIAHELRNFLTPLSMSVASVRSRISQEEGGARTCDIMERQVRNMTRLINDLLDISRLREGRIHLSRETVNLGEAVARAVEDVQSQIASRGHRLEVKMPPEPLFVDGDEMRLTQIFVNLLVNAAKYTAHEGEITLMAERTEGTCTVRVRDNGQGLSPEILPQVFELFTQGETGAHGGLGIGLNLVRGLVELHGGTVEAQSAGPGQGSEFIVRLPQAKKTPVLQTTPPIVESEPPGVSRRG